MDRFIFNKDYFEKEFMSGCSQEEKKAAIAPKALLSPSSVESKLLKGVRPITEEDYSRFKRVDPCFLLDTEKLIGKLILRVNKDLTPNERFVLYMMLCCLAEGDKRVSMDELTRRVTDGVYKIQKMEDILKNCTVIIDDSGKEEKLFKLQEGKYSIDLTALIKYTDRDC